MSCWGATRLKGGVKDALLLSEGCTIGGLSFTRGSRLVCRGQVDATCLLKVSQVSIATVEIQVWSCLVMHSMMRGLVHVALNYDHHASGI